MLSSYVVPEQVAADRDATRAEELLAEADISATDSTRVVLVAVPLAILVLGVVRCS